ncbi:MAG: AI-2E family transporter [Geminicoccaceae bacterium]|nr:AI-2E family transporter [Geminicoccaceae bacterium]
MAAFWDRGRIEHAAGWVALVSLAIGCVLVLKPFLSPLLWAAILVHTTWPVFETLRERLPRFNTTAALIMTVALAMALIWPIIILAGNLADNAENLLRDLRMQTEADPSTLDPPGWLLAVPYVGDSLAQTWRELASNTGKLVSTVVPYLGPLRDAAVKSGVTLGRGALELSLSILITFFFYRDGPAAVDLVRRIGHRVAGRRALRMLDVASNTIRGVVFGMIGTAIAQGLLAAFGLWLAGVPAPFLLGVLTFVLALFPVGAPLVWIPATLWLLNNGELAWGLFMGVWGAAVVSGVDNFLRPWLIARGSDLPFLLVFMGVIGGVLTFGILGIFLGPTLLAVASALLREWLTYDRRKLDEDDAGDEAGG